MHFSFRETLYVWARLHCVLWENLCTSSGFAVVSKSTIPSLHGCQGWQLVGYCYLASPPMKKAGCICKTHCCSRTFQPFPSTCIPTCLPTKKRVVVLVSQTFFSEGAHFAYRSQCTVLYSYGRFRCFQQKKGAQEVALESCEIPPIPKCWLSDGGVCNHSNSIWAPRGSHCSNQ